MHHIGHAWLMSVLNIPVYGLVDKVYGHALFVKKKSIVLSIWYVGEYFSSNAYKIT